MAFADKAINTYKQGVDVAGLVNEAEMAILSNISLQNKCLFEVIIYPQKFASSSSGLALQAVEMTVMKLYLHSIDDIVLTGVEYQRSGGVQWVKDLIYPESVTFSFIETGAGFIKAYLRKWYNEIAVPTSMNLSINKQISTTTDYIFRDDQESSKRNAIIIPLQPDMIPSSEWIYIEGLKLKIGSGLSYDHSSPDYELIAVQFSCDNIITKGQVL